MIDALEPLIELPGVRLVVLVTPDGVPIAVPGRHPGLEPEEEEPTAAKDGAPPDPLDDPEALSALSIGWLNEIIMATGPLSWETPQRVVLRAARGTLVLRRTHNAWLLLLLASGLRSEDVILSMEGTAARVERLVRSMGEKSRAKKGSQGYEPSPALPTQPPTAAQDEGLTTSSQPSTDLPTPQG